MIEDMCSIEINAKGKRTCEPPDCIRHRRPVFALFRNKTIDMRGALEIRIPIVWVRKGRTLTIVNAPAQGAYRIAITHLIYHGAIRVLRRGESEAKLMAAQPFIREKFLKEKS